MRLVEKLQRHVRNSETQNFLHPAYQQLLNRKLPAFITNEKPVSIGFVSLSYRTARKIRKRTLFYEPFPRVPPFYCERCGLASNRSRILVEHDCSKKFPYSDNANLPKLIEMAHRSRVKDALGVMERIPDPQKYDVKPAPIFSSLDFCPEVTERNPQRLKDITMRAVNDYFDVYEIAVDNNGAEMPPSCFTDALATTDANVGRQGTTKHAHFCAVCRRLFLRYRDYDDHLKGNVECLEHVDPILVDLHKPIPAARSIFSISTDASPSASSGSPMPSSSVVNGASEKARQIACTKCGRDDFTTKPELHEHFFECALRSEEDVEGDVGAEDPGVF